jgi:hypothetical protein
LPGFQDSLLRGYVLGEHGRTVGGQAIRTTTLVGFESGNQTSTLEPSEYLVEGAGRQVHAGKLLHVLDEGVAVLVASRETGKYEHGGSGVSAEPRERVIGSGHCVTISLSVVAVNDLVL